MTPRISFCIPTYNFAEFLPATLDSILKQADGRVEVVLVDGGSTDATDSIVADYQQRYEHIVFFKREQRCGVDRDILKSVEIASCDYCWLFSADDVLKPGAIDTVLNQIDRDPSCNALLMNFTLSELDLKPIGPHQVIDHYGPPRIFDWDNSQEREEYFDLALTSTAFFSFISAVVLRREDWLQADDCEIYIQSHWIIAAKIMSMAKNHLKVCYLPSEIFLKRGENDSFLSRGAAWRLRLSLQGFPAIAQGVFGQGTPEHRAFQKTVRNEWSFVALLNWKLISGQQGEDLYEFYSIVRENWVDSFSTMLQFRVIQCAPLWLIVCAKKLAQRSKAVHRWVTHIPRKKRN